MSKRIVNYLIFLILLYSSIAFAGPGGKIAKAVAETFWGKVILAILIILFLPLIIYTMLREYFAKRRVLNDLKIVAKVCPDFDWIKLRRRIQDCFYRVHAAWEKSNISEAAEWMTDWYWQNQQIVFLDRWERDGLVNICEVDKINYIKPILFSYRGDDKTPGEGSELAVLVQAHMTDYLERKNDGKLMEGSRKKKDVEKVWSFIYTTGRWVVSNIDEGANSMEYIEMMKTVPKIEDALRIHGSVVN
ncbi:MAG: Tim44 domain-containing protein [Desulfobacterales bacterium]|nr:Tim44 domain-containing protein [Desulfobacterales bacterium]